MAKDFISYLFPLVFLCFQKTFSGPCFSSLAQKHETCRRARIQREIDFLTQETVYGPQAYAIRHRIGQLLDRRDRTTSYAQSLAQTRRNTQETFVYRGARRAKTGEFYGIPLTSYSY